MYLSNGVKIENVAEARCLDYMKGKVGLAVGAKPCHGKRRSQAFQYTKAKRIVLHGAICLDIAAGIQPAGQVAMNKCKMEATSQMWAYHNDVSALTCLLLSCFLIISEALLAKTLFFRLNNSKVSARQSCVWH